MTLTQINPAVGIKPIPIINTAYNTAGFTDNMESVQSGKQVRLLRLFAYGNGNYTIFVKNGASTLFSFQLRDACPVLLDFIDLDYTISINSNNFNIQAVQTTAGYVQVIAFYIVEDE